MKEGNESTMAIVAAAVTLNMVASAEQISPRRQGIAQVAQSAMEDGDTTRHMLEVDD